MEEIRPESERQSSFVAFSFRANCLVMRKEAILQEIQIAGFTEKEYGMVRLENVGGVLFQALLFDNILVENKKLNVELYTMYIKESGL